VDVGNDGEDTATAACGVAAGPAMNLRALPDIAQAGVASFLGLPDLLTLTCAGKWAIQIFGALVRELVLRRLPDKRQPALRQGHWLERLLRRCTGLRSLDVRGRGAMRARIAEILARGTCRGLTTLSVDDLPPQHRAVLSQAMQVGHGGE
jgi:hypothetical protein